MIDVNKVLKAQTFLEGAGVKVNRAFDFQTRYETDPFLLLDFFGSDKKEEFVKGFPWHPHRGFETITYMLKGKVEHSDNKGHGGVIGPGDVQWMTAGKGIIHQEMATADSTELLGIQLWLNLPQELKMIDPKYRPVSSEEIPMVETNSARVKVIAGRFRKATGAVANTTVPVDMFDVKLWPDAIFDEALNPDFRYLMFVYEGLVAIPGYKDNIDALSGVILNQGTVFQVKAGESGAKFLLFGGTPYNEPIAWHGPIVMNTPEELSAAFDEIDKGTFA
ncbi:MAG: pirin family protein [Bacteroidales bacterium]|nr:pirin family protein [Bacteroidales bacterium]HPD96302.1 pirin family protein [Tenuifilaceae bacterium]HRX31381.1 pirin family protein [Tenuifilaceae bacterium]